ncbi:Rrf2 family transcriptional regulator [Gallaecimonas sp. GXIMD4217]|uniref:Rrf2 family transcriptional regulator n=1 Tax=Gallaecimonas sp. GXIMD4217 TaxID=3131927 RepID=UPI00311B3F58
MQLTKFTDFGIRILFYLAQKPGQRVPVEEITLAYDLSKHHVVKIIQRLAQLGYVQTSRGKGGGVTLLADPRMVRMGTLVRELEPTMKAVDCANPRCAILPICRLKHWLNDAVQAYIKELDQYSLADMMAGIEDPFPAQQRIL